MSGSYLAAALAFLAGSLLLMVLLSQLLRLRGQKKDGAGPDEHGLGWDLDSGDGGGDGGD